MALELGEYIDDLVVTNPTGNDNRRQGDDHLRLLKKVLTQSFPNIDSAVTATPAELNITADATRWFPAGGIIMWGGLIANIPSGWALCNGTGSVGGVAIPDLRDRFIIGADADAGGVRDVNDTAGDQDTTITITEGHAITEAEMPSHTHDLSSTLLEGSGDTEGTAARVTPGIGVAQALSTGGDAAHTHGVATITDGNMPKYYALAYIIKL